MARPAKLAKTLEIRTSPHLVGPASVDVTMFNVALALLPATAFGIWAFGLAAAALVATAVGSCLVAEWLATRSQAGGSTLFDQTKAVLAIIGVLAVAVQVWRMSSRREEYSDED